jgi:hypothetical protein
MTGSGRSIAALLVYFVLFERQALPEAGRPLAKGAKPAKKKF